MSAFFIPDDAARTFNVVLAFLGKHGIPLGGLSLLADAVSPAGKRFTMMWMSYTGDIDEVRVWHHGCCVLNCKFDGQLHVLEPIGETGLCLADQLLLALPLG